MSASGTGEGAQFDAAGCATLVDCVVADCDRRARSGEVDESGPSDDSSSVRLALSLSPGGEKRQLLPTLLRLMHAERLVADWLAANMLLPLLQPVGGGEDDGDR